MWQFKEVSIGSYRAGRGNRMTMSRIYKFQCISLVTLIETKVEGLVSNLVNMQLSRWPRGVVGSTLQNSIL